MSELANKFDVHSNQIKQWKEQLLAGVAHVFDGKAKAVKVYLWAYDSVTVARQSLRRYIDFNNAKRPHSSLDGRTPDLAYHEALRPVPVAA